MPMPWRSLQCLMEAILPCPEMVPQFQTNWISRYLWAIIHLQSSRPELVEAASLAVHLLPIQSTWVRHFLSLPGGNITGVSNPLDYNPRCFTRDLASVVLQKYATYTSIV